MKITNNNLCKALFIGLVCTVSAIAGAKERVISGTVYDAQSGEILIGANVFDASTGKGSTTNAQGHYSLWIPHTGDSLRLAVCIWQTHKNYIYVDVKSGNYTYYFDHPWGINGDLWTEKRKYRLGVGLYSNSPHNYKFDVGELPIPNL